MEDYEDLKRRHRERERSPTFRQWHDDMAQRYAEAGSPDVLQLFADWLFTDGPERPLTVAQAAERLGVKPQTIRRRVETWAEQGLAYRTGDGTRAPWRISPAALTVKVKRGKPQPERPSRRPRKKTTGKRPSSTRWEI